MQSIVEYPERGTDGRNSYRGNCSGKLVEDLIHQFKVRQISDYMCGSGTTEDVAKRLNIESHCYDLNRGFDLVSMDIPERNQFIFWHPPYGDMIIYSGEQYSAEDVQRKYGFDPREHDLSRCKDWEQFVKMMNYCCMKQFASLETGGRMAVLMGDMKRKGVCYSMLCDIAKPGTLENIVIKRQNNCVSDRRTYSNTNFIPIVHEYVMIVRKGEPLIIPVSLPRKYTMDMRDMATATWRDVLYSVMEDAKQPVTLNFLYESLAPSKKAERNPHFKEKIRQTLQRHPCFFHEQGGCWKIA